MNGGCSTSYRERASAEVEIGEISRLQRSCSAIDGTASVG
jgi:hypothetical protein